MIIPTIFSHNKDEFLKKLEALDGLTSYLQIDIMDGEFVEEESVSLEDIPDMKDYSSLFEAHLMVENPFSFIRPLAKRGFRRVIVHCESTDGDELKKTLLQVQRGGMDPVTAINPETSLERLESFIEITKKVLVMGVPPGRENQEFLEETITRVKTLRQKHPSLKIQVDGGVTPETASALKDAGADSLNSGSYVFQAEEPAEALKKLKKAFN